MLVSVEKRALSIMTGTYVINTNYHEMCTEVGLVKLEKRWELLAINFGLSTLKHSRYCSWLSRYQITRKPGFNSRSNTNQINFRLVPSRYERYRGLPSPLPFPVISYMCYSYTVFFLI